MRLDFFAKAGSRSAFRKRGVFLLLRLCVQVEIPGAYYTVTTTSVPATFLAFVQILEVELIQYISVMVD